MAERLLGQKVPGQAFVISAPAGTGKTTLTTMLKHEFPNRIISSISYTTRKPRPMEVEGAHYHFINREEFEKRIHANDLLEHVQLYDDYYGTSRSWTEQQLAQGQHLLLVIDTQGAMQLKGKLPATFIFIKPPSLDILRMRLESRKTETREVIEKRLAWAEKEMESARLYDYQITNDDLELTYAILRSIVIAQTHHT
jgi:guanylate kinase